MLCVCQDVVGICVGGGGGGGGFRWCIVRPDI